MARYALCVICLISLSCCADEEQHAAHCMKTNTLETSVAALVEALCAEHPQPMRGLPEVPCALQFSHLRRQLRFLLSANDLAPTSIACTQVTTSISPPV